MGEFRSLVNYLLKLKMREDSREDQDFDIKHQTIVQVQNEVLTNWRERKRKGENINGRNLFELSSVFIRISYSLSMFRAEVRWRMRLDGILGEKFVDFI